MLVLLAVRVFIALCCEIVCTVDVIGKLLLHTTHCQSAMSLLCCTMVILVRLLTELQCGSLNWGSPMADGLKNIKLIIQYELCGQCLLLDYLKSRGFELYSVNKWVMLLVYVILKYMYSVN